MIFENVNNNVYNKTIIYNYTTKKVITKLKDINYKIGTFEIKKSTKEFHPKISSKKIKKRII
jgi:hypothetical protein